MTWRWSRAADPSCPLIPRHVREPGGFLGAWAASQRAADDKPSYSWAEQTCPEAVPAASRSVLLGVPHEVGSGVETKHALQKTSLRGPWGRCSKAVCYSKSCVLLLKGMCIRDEHCSVLPIENLFIFFFKSASTASKISPSPFKWLL